MEIRNYNYLANRDLIIEFSDRTRKKFKNIPLSVYENLQKTDNLRLFIDTNITNKYISESMDPNYDLILS